MSEEVLRFRSGEQWVGCHHLKAIYPKSQWPGCAKCDEQWAKMFAKMFSDPDKIPRVLAVDEKTSTITYGTE